MRIFLITVFTVLLSACGAVSEKNNAVEENKKLVETYFTHFNKHEWQQMAEMYTDTADFKDPTLGAGIVKQTRAQTIQKYSELSALFPDVKDSIVAMYTSGDNNVVVEFISTGTAPDSSKFTLPICTIFTIENGKISKDFTYFDNFE